MKKTLSLLFLMVLTLSSCSDLDKVLKSSDFDVRYEAAKQYYFDGKYDNSATLLVDLIAAAKGTDRAEETLYLLGMSAYKAKNYDAASGYFKKYYETYPKGTYVEEARLFSGRSLYMNTPQPNLDQSDTYAAITEFQMFTENFPNSKYHDEAMSLIFELQDKLIEKEFAAAKLYYNLGSYFGNCTNGGSNYQACIVTAQNAINDYPYTPRREEFAVLILKAKFDLADQSVESKKMERCQSAIDEFQGFLNEFPESNFRAEAQKRYEKAKAYVDANDRR